MAKFKKGDKVQLNTGGPEMTIVGVYEKNSQDYSVAIAYEAYQQKFGASDAFYGCNWFDKSSLKDGAFPEETLKLLD